MKVLSKRSSCSLCHRILRTPHPARPGAAWCRLVPAYRANANTNARASRYAECRFRVRVLHLCEGQRGQVVAKPRGLVPPGLRGLVDVSFSALARGTLTAIICVETADQVVEVPVVGFCTDGQEELNAVTADVTGAPTVGAYPPASPVSRPDPNARARAAAAAARASEARRPGSSGGRGGVGGAGTLYDVEPYDPTVAFGTMAVSSSIASSKARNTAGKMAAGKTGGETAAAMNVTQRVKPVGLRSGGKGGPEVISGDHEGWFGETRRLATRDKSLTFAAELSEPSGGAGKATPPEALFVPVEVDARGVPEI